MAIITPDERRAIQERLRAMGSPNLALIYGDATGEDAAWTLTQSPLVVVVQLIGRIGEDATMTITVCDALVQMTPLDPGNPALAAIADRLRAQAAQASALPEQELWIGAEPMVNRSGLRSLLREISGGFNHGVIYVAGGPMSGRSHSFQLIRHVARCKGIPHPKADFAVKTEERTFSRLWESLRTALGIDADGEPTFEGATPGDVAEKFIDHLRTRLGAAPVTLPKPWVVIDYSEDVSDPVVPEFLRMLCAARDAAEFDTCVIFVLGPPAYLDSMRAEMPNLQVEDLGRVTQTEIFDAASAVNLRGSQKLGDVALNARAAKIYDDVMQLGDDAQFPALRRALLDLRREVRAP